MMSSVQDITCVYKRIRLVMTPTPVTLPVQLMVQHPYHLFRKNSPGFGPSQIVRTVQKQPKRKLS